ncbi:BTB/POZ domain-containing protein 8-like [Liolophura sinensis]|uniref:BTB/POZ domain-containing protein 8-like n=1 Tax=Liolophura sinensis TaxID=3198878 RepID=UPI0031588F50
MAKPKEKIGQLSTAFLEKCDKVKDRLRKKVAKQLRADIERMLQEEIHPDLEFHLKGGNSVGHKLILKSRARNLWDRLCEVSGSDCVLFSLQSLHKSIFDSYLLQVYGSENADIASAELVHAIEDRVNPQFPSSLVGSHTSDDMFASGGAESNADKLPRADRISVDSLETDSERVLGVPLPPSPSDTGAKGGHSVLTCEQANGELPGRVESGNIRDFTDTGESHREAFELFHGAYSLDMIPSTHFAAGHDMLAADPSSLFVLPNGQEINNNDANNNGLDANQLVGNQNLASPRVVNLQPQVVDLVSHTVPAQLSTAASLPDVQSQDTSRVHGAGAHAALPDLIKTSWCTILPHQTCSRLGDDLLRVYLQEIDCDCTISVDSQDFKCHRCVLAARSSYFTAMLGGAWLESDADKILLEGVSPAAVEQALLYIYGGVVELTDTCSVTELILLSDMYGLEGLRDVISLTLRITKCHFFHKPCAGCIIGTVEALSIAESYRLEELEERCIKWINRNLTKVWPTKGFALLPEATLQKCCQSAVQDLTPGTVLDVIMECDKLSTSLPRLKWTEPVLSLITHLMDSAMEYTSQNFTDVIDNERFIALGKSMAWSMTLLDTIFSSVIKSLPVEHICKTYLCIHVLTERAKDSDCSWTEDFQNFLVSLLKKCEGYIKLYVHQVVHTADWDLLSKDLQQNLLEAASYVCIDTNRGRVPPKLSSMNKRSRQPAVPRTGNASKPSSSTKSKPPVTDSSKLEKSLSNASLQKQFQKRLASERAQRVERAGASGGGIMGSGNVMGNGSVLGNGRGFKTYPKSAAGRTRLKAPASYKTVSESSKARESSQTQVGRPDNSRPRSSSLINPETSEPGPSLVCAPRSRTDQACVSQLADPSLPARRRRRGSTGDIPAVLVEVSRSRSEEFHLTNRGDNSVMQLVPIFDTKFSLPNQIPPSNTEEF